MNTRALLIVATLALPASAGLAQDRPAATMPAFASDSELVAYLRRALAEGGSPRGMHTDNAGAAMGAAQAPTMAAASADAITNIQQAGVDEGDIVKLHGDYLVILRRGRLFTVAVGDNALRPVDAVNSFGPGIDPGGTWYDEMLISGDKVVVIGYSYERGGTEVGIFRISDNGSLRYLSTFQLRSNDYYSSRNYAARLIGSRLVFYAPIYLGWGGENIRDMLPAMRRWSRQPEGRGFEPIALPEHFYRPAGWHATANVALHTITSCDLAAAQIKCEASVVVGPPGNVFYVSEQSVFVWMMGWQAPRFADARVGALLVRIPLDGGAPSAMSVAGSPVDQFSFLDSGDGYLNVMTRGGAAGDAMWSGEYASGPAALLRLPISRMGDGSRAAPSWWYRALQPPAGGTMQNRFVGNFLLYGSGSGWGIEGETDANLFVVPWRGGDATTLHLAHGIDRIEVMGDQAVVVGVHGSDLEFSGIHLGRRPAVEQRYTLAQASQGELRSHGFFYRADSDEGGVLGLPVREENQPGYMHLIEGSASILFLQNTDHSFRRLGVLHAGAVRNADDSCRASCVDWYGNARPLFLRGRVFALLGYEIVEGQLRGEQLHEVRRTSFAPGLVRAVSHSAM
ncbi:MAG: beta-propeller domain-containing protein [Gemmatimonadales bacterium]